MHNLSTIENAHLTWLMLVQAKLLPQICKYTKRSDLLGVSYDLLHRETSVTWQDKAVERRPANISPSEDRD